MLKDNEGDSIYPRFYNCEGGKTGTLCVGIIQVIYAEKSLIDHSEGALPPPGARLALARMGKDPRNEPQYGERYPLVTLLYSTPILKRLLTFNTDLWLLLVNQKLG